MRRRSRAWSRIRSTSRPGLLFPEATEADVQRHPWLVPDWADADGNIELRTQAFVVEIDGLTVLVDPCVGNGKVRWLPVWNDLDLPFLERLADAGCVPDDVELVVHTHLHADHVGWDTHRTATTWVPTFTGARHLYTEAELEFVRTSQPPRRRRVRRLDRADLRRRPRRRRRARRRPRARLRLELDAGSHARAHVAVDRVGRRARADHRRLHAPPGAVRGAAARRDRRRRRRSSPARPAPRMLREMARTGALVLGTHFPSRPAGRVRADGDAWRFVPE